MDSTMLRQRLQKICDAGRSIQAESGGPDADYYRAAVREADRLIEALIKELGSVT